MRRPYQLATAVCLILLWSCAAEGPTPQTPEQQIRQRAEELVRADDRVGALELYSELAATTAGDARIDYLIAGTRLLIDGGETDDARRWLAQARSDGNARQAETILVLSAAIELSEDRPEAAIDLLSRLSQPPDDVNLV